MRHIEEVRQAELVIWTHKKCVREAMPALRFIHHSPNGGKRSAFTGAQMKAMGVKPGFPDLILPARGVDPSIPGLVIEMKSDDGRLSRDQVEWRDHFLEQGWAWHLVREVEEGKAIILAYFGIPNDPAA